MSIPYNVKTNNYFNNKKSSTVYTPSSVSEYIHSRLNTHITPKVIVDPSIGKGALINPWRKKGCKTIGIDIDEHSRSHCDKFIHGKFEDIEYWSYEMPDLVVCNPPFNAAPSRKLYSEVFLRNIVELFGNKVPIVLFTPMGFRKQRD